MPTYGVIGPIVIPTYEGKAAKVITADKIEMFWKVNPGLPAKRGCYVFGIRAGKGIRPFYVGRATKNFKREVFQPHKLAKYQQTLADYRKGTPVLFFVAAPGGKGAPNVSAVEEMEDYLIQTAVTRNPHLLNVKGTKREQFAIAGVLRSGVGKPSKSARSFRQCMGIKLAF